MCEFCKNKGKWKKRKTGKPTAQFMPNNSGAKIMKPFLELSEIIWTLKAIQKNFANLQTNKVFLNVIKNCYKMREGKNTPTYCKKKYTRTVKGCRRKNVHSLNLLTNIMSKAFYKLFMQLNVSLSNSSIVTNIFVNRADLLTCLLENNPKAKIWKRQHRNSKEYYSTVGDKCYIPNENTVTFHDCHKRDLIEYLGYS